MEQFFTTVLLSIEHFHVLGYWVAFLAALLVILIAWIMLWFVQYYLPRYGNRLWQATVLFGRTLRSRFADNPYVCRWMREHPGSIQFLAKRADYTHFFGLPLTLLVLSLAVTLVLLAEVAEDVATADSIVVVDHIAARLISTFRAPELIPIAIWITNWCAPPIIGVLLVVACLLLWLVNRRFAAVGLVISLLGASLFSVLNKLVFQRLRPDGAVLLEPSYSFPSSHATLSVAFYGFLGYLLIRSAKKWDTRIKLCFVMMGFIFLIGLSRIVLGVHYLSDVWAGYLVGLLWLIVGISVNEWLAATGRIDWNLPVGRYRKIMVFSLMLVAAIGVAGYLFTQVLIFRDLQ
ncbi:undecaprenyl-diphosphatase [Nitrosomonas eutropha]|uniref:Undecaprenyl-diphosphatase n=1 Tax=Nitrosomonas eutropha TaxID=916 RepID=A0A1I7IR51_9PROT|nr:phosphatase PAP2 family protein [Nitrosomonas eutropha]SFU75331.1 undecaprenyl-diphosphatase [Nitrosomonas eutropha]